MVPADRERRLGPIRPHDFAAALTASRHGGCEAQAAHTHSEPGTCLPGYREDHNVVVARPASPNSDRNRCRRLTGNAGPRGRFHLSFSVIRHPEVRAERTSKDGSAYARAASFEARFRYAIAGTSG